MPSKGTKGSGATRYPRRRAERSKPPVGRAPSKARIVEMIKQRGMEQELTLLRLAFEIFREEVRERLSMSPTEAEYGPVDDPAVAARARKALGLDAEEE